MPPLLVTGGVVSTQTLGAPMQVKQSSTVQLALQPSPVDVLPSSQTSLLAMTPSPHVLTHTEGAPSQLQPDSSAHSDEQPSPAVPLPSSQPSTPARMPSPHAPASQTEGEPPHVHPSST